MPALGTYGGMSVSGYRSLGIPITPSINFLAVGGGGGGGLVNDGGGAGGG